MRTIAGGITHPPSCEYSSLIAPSRETPPATCRERNEPRWLLNVADPAFPGPEDGWHWVAYPGSRPGIGAPHSLPADTLLNVRRYNAAESAVKEKRAKIPPRALRGASLKLGRTGAGVDSAAFAAPAGTGP